MFDYFTVFMNEFQPLLVPQVLVFFNNDLLFENDSILVSIFVNFRLIYLLYLLMFLFINFALIIHLNLLNCFIHGHYHLSISLLISLDELLHHYLLVFLALFLLQMT